MHRCTIPPSARSHRFPSVQLRVNVSMCHKRKTVMASDFVWRWNSRVLNPPDSPGSHGFSLRFHGKSRKKSRKKTVNQFSGDWKKLKVWRKLREWVGFSGSSIIFKHVKCPRIFFHIVFEKSQLSCQPQHSRQFQASNQLKCSFNGLVLV